MSEKRSVVMPDDFKDDKLPKGTFSHSQYQEYKKCPKSYEFKYVAALPSKRTASMVRGISIHSLVEYAVKAKISGRLAKFEEVRDVATDLLKTNLETVEDWEDDKPEAVTNTVVDAYTAWHTYALPKLKPIAVEQGFAAKVAGVPMIGYIDLIDSDPISPEEGSPVRQVVVDLKTTTKSWSQDQVDKNTQLTLYSRVANTADVRIDQLVQLKRGVEYRPLVSTRDITQQAVFEEDLAETADLIKRGVFPRTSIDHWSCGPRCSYWTSCRGRAR